MTNIKKIMMLSLGILSMSLTYSRSKASSGSSSTSSTSTTQSSAPKPMANSIPTTAYTVTNSTSYNVLVIFYDSFTNALTSYTNLGSKRPIDIPVGATYFSVRSGSSEVISYSKIYSQTSYIILYNNSTWSVLPPAPTPSPSSVKA
jgi:hypothetical protein